MRERKRKVQCNSGREKVTVVCVLLAASEQSKQARKSRNMTKEADQDERECWQPAESSSSICCTSPQEENKAAQKIIGQKVVVNLRELRHHCRRLSGHRTLSPSFSFFFSQTTQSHNYIPGSERERKRAQFNLQWHCAINFHPNQPARQPNIFNW